jgi:hypothetical protein
VVEIGHGWIDREEKSGTGNGRGRISDAHPPMVRAGTPPTVKIAVKIAAVWVFGSFPARWIARI